MDDRDFMNRAFELARRGAGLVSPNPMVGAVLVGNGRVIGEGFHRYDRVRHAESYAIESAGRLARGATLYCSLEPCCHHGRTPPCTDALIEAGIARAVVACLDPDPRVGGRGISQLRSAGITVEVGLGEARAARINETYFKYIRQGIAFVHAVVECDAGARGGRLDWVPSTQFTQMASEYDALWLGRDQGINRAIINSSLSRKRHRPLVLIGHESRFDPATVAGLESRADEVELVVLQSGEEAASFCHRLQSADESLRELRVTSLLILPDGIDASAACGLAGVDKATLVTPPGCDEEFDPGLDEMEVNSAGDYNEVTGYPRPK